MRKKPKTARLVEPNQGSSKALQKKLHHFSRKFTKLIFEQVIEHLVSKNILAQDASLTHFDDERQKTLRTLGFKIRREFRGLKNVEQEIDLFMARNAPLWVGFAEREIKVFCWWYVQTSARDVTASQRLALTSAGISPTMLKKRWNVPVGRRYLSPQAAKALPGIVEEMTSYITKMTSNNLAKLQAVMIDGFENGQSLSKLRKTLYSFQGFDEARATRVALDQTRKVTLLIRRKNDESLGIEEGIWKHIPGQFTSRDSHRKMDGKRFKLSEGLYDEDVGEKVFPGQLINCRCSYRAVLPPELLGEE